MHLRVFVLTLFFALAISSNAQTQTLVSPISANANSRPAPTIFLIGDSTMADKPVIPAHPERGWGQMLPMYFKTGARIENRAVNGRSTKSFLDEGRWTNIVEQLQSGDFVIIQFGHNDQKTQDPKRFAEPFGDFTRNLEKFISETRERKALPILATPIARRKFDDAGTLQDTHGDYVKAVHQVAAKQNVPLLELNARSSDLLSRMGPELSKKLFDWIEAVEFENVPKGLRDDTHFNAYGASRICDLAVEEIKKSVPQLAAWLREK